MELVHQRVKKGQFRKCSIFAILLTKGCNYCLANAAEKMIRDQLHFPGSTVDRQLSTVNCKIFI